MWSGLHRLGGRRCGPTQHAGSKYAVKPCAGGTHAVERSCQSPIGEHESAFCGIAQLSQLVTVRAQEVRVAVSGAATVDGDDVVGDA
jgi:hypothetical protein